MAISTYRAPAARPSSLPRPPVGDERLLSNRERAEAQRLLRGDGWSPARPLTGEALRLATALIAENLGVRRSDLNRALRSKPEPLR